MMRRHLSGRLRYTRDLRRVRGYLRLYLFTGASRHHLSLPFLAGFSTNLPQIQGLRSMGTDFSMRAGKPANPQPGRGDGAGEGRNDGFIL